MDNKEIKKQFLDQMGWKVIPICLMKYITYDTFCRTLYYLKVLREYYTEEEVLSKWNEAKEWYDVKSLHNL